MIISSTAVHIYMIFIYLQSLKWPFRSVMIFSISIDPLKSLLTVRRKFFHQNDATVHFRSFPGFSRIKYTSHRHDFLLLNFDHGKEHR